MHVGKSCFRQACFRKPHVLVYPKGWSKTISFNVPRWKNWRSQQGRQADIFACRREPPNGRGSGPPRVVDLIRGNEMRSGSAATYIRPCLQHGIDANAR